MKTHTVTITKLECVTPQEIVCVYKGKPGCAYGCNGTYYYATEHREYAGKDRGYEVTDDEINDKKVAWICGILNKNAADVEVTENYILSFETDEIVYRAYLKQPEN
jgi:hypothetical protein